MVLLQALRAALGLMCIAEHRQPDKRGGGQKGKDTGQAGPHFYNIWISCRGPQYLNSGRNRHEQKEKRSGKSQGIWAGAEQFMWPRNTGRNKTDGVEDETRRGGLWLEGVDMDSWFFPDIGYSKAKQPSSHSYEQKNWQGLSGFFLDSFSAKLSGQQWGKLQDLLFGHW